MLAFTRCARSACCGLRTTEHVQQRDTLSADFPSFRPTELAVKVSFCDAGVDPNNDSLSKSTESSNFWPVFTMRSTLIFCASYGFNGNQQAGLSAKIKDTES